MKSIKNILLATALLLSGLSASAQDGPIEKARAKGWEFELRAGVNLGGAVPVPMPAEIRSIDSYSPGLNAILEGVATKWLEPQSHWGVMTGLRFEQKSMKTSATTKGYATTMENDGNSINGLFSGKVYTDYSATMITLPIQAVYRINEDGKVNAGMYVSYRLGGDFAGYVTDGYFREGSPIGEKMVFGPEQKAYYSFKNQLGRVETGMQIGGSWRAYKHFLVFADLKYSFSEIFKKDSFMSYTNMHPLYLSVGFSYLF